jgi:glutamate/tyrosine decarboxylase-like PLP-dependent enzyme
MDDIVRPQKKSELPQFGLDRHEVLQKMRARRQEDARWQDGRTFSLVYHASDEHTEFLKEAFSLFFSENALNPAAFRSLQQFEVEVVAMVAELLGGDERTTGTMSSGGTESIFLALKTYRDRARARSPHIKEQEVILPITAHPAFDKAAHCLDIKLIHVPVDAAFRADLTAVRAAISDRTILLVGSAPAYPQGVIDPIAELAALAAERNLGMHVDACLGGLLLPFLQQLGHKVPPFDFRVPGVTSMSADLHKYGFAAKGASTVLYRDAELRQYQFYVRSDWPGGLFGSTTLAGTRPGGPIAAAWAAMQAMGRDGYLRTAANIMEITQAFLDGIRKIPELQILGQPDMSVFAFTAQAEEGKPVVDILAIADAMEARGWHVDRQQNPSSLHLMITPAHGRIVEQYLHDLRESVEHVRRHPELSMTGNAATYGMLARIPERGVLAELILQHMNELYRT